MKKLIFTFFLIFGLTQFNLGQGTDINTGNNLSRTYVITLGGGVTLAKADYPSTKLGSLFKSSFEYNFPSSSSVTFGIKLFGARGVFNGEDRIGVTKEFQTPFWYVGAGPSITFTLSEKVYTTISAGVSSLWFYPKDIRDNRLPNFAANVYDNQILATNVDISLRFMTSDKISLNLFGGVFAGNSTNNDYFDDLNSGDAIDLVFSTGVTLSYYFWVEKDIDGDGIVDSKDMCPNTPKGVKVDDFGCPLDTDGDGIADYLDKCSDTPKGVKVDSYGCPLDTDGDGVADYLDKCPNTPSGVKIDSDGCPLDTDGDGVADYLDKCPDTPKNNKVDNNGCSILEPIIIGTVANFTFDSFNLLKDSYPKLNKLANSMKEQTQYIAIVEGYTDAYGQADYNMILSKRRVESVINYLVSKGVDRDRFRIQAYGETNPVASNKTKDGRASNRRVVVKLMQKN